MADNTGTLPNVDAVLDTTGLYCPEPIMLMHNKVRDMASGQVLIATFTLFVWLSSLKSTVSNMRGTHQFHVIGLA